MDANGWHDAATCEAERTELREALQALYDAMPTGYGEDRALNEALVGAEQALGIEKKVSHV